MGKPGQHLRAQVRVVSAEHGVAHRHELFDIVLIRNRPQSYTCGWRHVEDEVAKLGDE
jgi:hypothetical protein